MKILIVSFYFSPELGAAPSRISNMVYGLKQKGNKVDVLTCLPNYPKGEIFKEYKNCLYKKDIIEGSDVYRYWTYATVSKNPILRGISMVSFAVIMWCFALKISLIKSYDKVIIQTPPLPVAGSAVLLFKLLYRKKVILNVSDLWPSSAVELGAMKDNSFIYSVFSSIERFIYRKSDAVLCQSNEILEHISTYPSPPKKFLYRNLQRYELQLEPKIKNKVVKIVYAGLLGVAQDIYGIVENVDFCKLGVEFHIYGGGNQTELINKYINDNKECNIYYHGYVEKSRIAYVLSQYDAALIPLAVRIKGAVPSKIFDMLPLGIPLFFCGGGEGAQIVLDNNLGYISNPGDYYTLSNNIKSLVSLSNDEYHNLSLNCISTCSRLFNFNKQIENCLHFLEQVK